MKFFSRFQNHTRGIKLVYSIKGVVELSVPKLSSISAIHWHRVNMYPIL